MLLLGDWNADCADDADFRGFFFGFDLKKIRENPRHRRYPRSNQFIETLCTMSPTSNFLTTSMPSKTFPKIV